MKLHVEHVAMLVVHGLPRDGGVELPDGATAADLLHRLKVAPAHQPAVTFFVNNQRVRPTRVLRDGDRVFLGLPMSGG